MFGADAAVVAGMWVVALFWVCFTRWSFLASFALLFGTVFTEPFCDNLGFVQKDDVLLV